MANVGLPQIQIPDVGATIQQGLKLREAQRGQQLESTLSQLMQKGATPEQMTQGLANQGFGSQAFELQQQINKNAPEQIDSKEELAKAYYKNLATGRLSEANEIGRFMIQKYPEIANEIPEEGYEETVGDLTIKQNRGYNSNGEVMVINSVYDSSGKLVNQDTQTFEGIYGTSITPEVVRERGIIEEEFDVKKEIRAEKKARRSEIRKAVMSKRYDDAQQGIVHMDIALDMIEQEPYIYRDFVGRKLGRGESGKFETALRGAQDIITRIRTGAALNKQEIDFYDKLYSPGWFNDTENAVWKMELLKEIFIETVRRLENPESDLENIDIREIAKDFQEEKEGELPEDTIVEEEKIISKEELRKKYNY